MISLPDDLAAQRPEPGEGLHLLRLGPSSAPLLAAVRRRMFALEPRAFRYAPEDEDRVPLEAGALRLSQAFVVVACIGRNVAGIGGFERAQGRKTDHKGSIFGMFVEPEQRGRGAADAIMAALLDHAAGKVECVDLSVVAGNMRAIRFYERWGFSIYATEPAAIRLGPGDDLDECWMRLRFDDRAR